MKKQCSGGCWWLLVGTMVLYSAGCDRVGFRDARERESQVVVRAYTLLEAGDFAAAAVAFRRALDENPTLARPHLDLALLLHDQRQDLVRAIYHYERYLELRPSTEKAEMIQARIAAARDALVASYRGTNHLVVAASPVPAVADAIPEPPVAVSTGAVAAASRSESAETVALREERNRLRVSLAEQERVLDAKQARIQELEGRVRVLADELANARAMVPVRGQGEVGLGVLATQTVAGTAARGVRTYEVRSNDSLSGIAHKVYGDATKWRLIQAANREVLGDSEILRIGQVLVIPDVEE